MASAHQELPPPARRLQQLLLHAASGLGPSVQLGTLAAPRPGQAGGDNVSDGMPNILYIISDQHSPFVTGCYGDKVVDTPNLDRLAMAGVVCDAAYCASPICVPARMSMLTGRHPYENDCWTNNDHLETGIPTFAHSLGAAGYRPVLAGRMHSNGPDQLHGYADRLVGDHGPNQPGGIPVTKGVPGGTAGPFRVSLEVSGHGQSSYEVHDEVVTQAAVDFLRQQRNIRKALPPGEKAAPFCLSVGLMLPHQPFIARRADYDKYKGRVPPPKIPAEPMKSLHPAIRRWRETQGIAAVPASEVERSRVAYWALVDSMDRMIGELLAELDEAGLTDDTLICYMSDHGEQAGERGLWWKQTFYEQSVRVPLIFHWPNGPIAAGTRCNRVVSTLDVSATILSFVGAPALPASSGRSMVPLLCDFATDTPWEDVAFSEFCGEGLGGPPDPYTQRMLRKGRWKLIYYHEEEQPQLFDLEADPDELHDRAMDPQCSDILETMCTLLLNDWNPAAIAARVQVRNAESALLSKWAKQIQPPDVHRWSLQQQMDYLDADNEVANPGPKPDPTYKIGRVM